MKGIGKKGFVSEHNILENDNSIITPLSLERVYQLLTFANLFTYDEWFEITQMIHHPNV